MMRKEFQLNQNYCKFCGICVALCPVQALGRDNEGRPFMEYLEKCIGCRLCEYRCPDFAIRMEVER